MSFSPTNPTGTNGSAALGTTFNITAANGVFQNVGLSFTLPSAGTYIINADVHATLQISAGTYALIDLQFYNTTDGAVVAGSLRRGPYCGSTSVASLSTTPMQKIITISGAKTFDLQAARINGTTYLNSSVDNQYTEVSWVKLT